MNLKIMNNFIITDTNHISWTIQNYYTTNKLKCSNKIFLSHPTLDDKGHRPFHLINRKVYMISPKDLYKIYIQISRISMFKNVFKLLRVSAPLLLMSPYLHKSYNCFFWNTKRANDLNNRIYIDVEVSNKPCEDRSAKIQLKSIGGYAFAVYDGHGGWQVVSYTYKAVAFMLKNAIINT